MFIRVAIWFIFSWFFSVSVVRSQTTDFTSASDKRNQLSRYRNDLHIKWMREKKTADSLAKVLNIPTRSIYPNGQILSLQRFEKDMPVYYTTHNLNAAKTISVNDVWEATGNYLPLTGYGVTVGVWDGSFVRHSHETFASDGAGRIINGDQSVNVSDHPTHITATIIGGRTKTESRGMAPASKAVVFDFDNDLSEMAAEALNGLQVSNHSYGTFCGWHYNSLENMWYWYGDVHISEEEDYKFGWYSQTSADLDFLAYNAPQYLMVKSAGNERNDAPSYQPVSHYFWDGNWILSNQIHQPDGGLSGYETLAPMALAKNILTVGAIEDIPEGYQSPEDVIMTAFSSWGPTDDGRIKPDVVANGSDLLSALSDDDVSYGSFSGTSMATASVSGSVALLYELNNKLLPGCRMKSASVKALIMHTADACGPYPGPDYRYGWGLVNIKKAADLLVNNWSNGGQSLIESVLTESTQKQFRLTVLEGTENFKVTLCWTDPPGEAMPYELNPNQPVLVNDLDVKVNKVGDSNTFYPWKLNPADPDMAAFKGDNDRDNVEQVELIAPDAGSYLITVSHKANLEGAIQPFSLVMTGMASDSLLYPPSNLSYRMEADGIALKWYAPENIPSAFDKYRLYRNGALLCETTDTLFMDCQLRIDSVYEYSVKAVYGEHESMATNYVFAQHRGVLSLPYFFDFEDYQHGWEVKNNYTGWCWGLADTLSAYYLDFSQNDGRIMGINSYSVGEGIHVSDFALSPPFDLSNYKSVTVLFDYIFITDIYEAIDTLEFGYQMPDGCWNFIQKLPKAIHWTPIEFILPQEALLYGVRFGFRFDDNYLWGMGAGIDDFSIDGSLNTHILEVKQESVNMYLHSLNQMVISVNDIGRSDYLLSLFNMVGQSTFSKRLYFSPGEEKIISLPNVASGCYLIQLKSATDSYIKKIIVSSP